METSRDKDVAVGTGLFEMDAVKDFGAKMQRLGVLDWWRKAMEFDNRDDRL